MNGLLQDVRYALGSLLKSPGFAAVAILTLGLGIGASSTLFSMLDAVLFRALPFQDAERVVEISGRDSERSGMRVPAEIVAAIRDRSATIESLALHGPDGGALRTREGLVRIFGRHVSANYFSVLGVQPMLGRNFLPHEDNPAAPTVVIVSHRFWQTHLGRDSKALGQPIYIDDTAYTVVGVMPHGFHTSFFGRRGGEDFWTTYVTEATRAFESKEGYELTARLAESRSVDEARHELQAISSNVAVIDSDWNQRGRSIDLVPKKQEIVGDSAQALQLLFAAVGLVLAIACANLALLSVARADGRAAEFATRKAIGAHSSRLFRLALLESLLVSAAGAVAGIAVSHWLLPVMIALAPAEIPRISGATVDMRVLSFAIALSVVMACAFGVIPAFRLARLSVVDTLKGRKGFGSIRTARLRGVLVAAQVAGAVALLVVGGLIGRTFLSLLPLNPGFTSDGLTVFHFALPPPKSVPMASRSQTIDELIGRLEAAPGVLEAGYALNIPFGGDDGFRFVRDMERPIGPTELYVDVRPVSPNFFQLLRIPLYRGRMFTGDDRSDAIPRAAIVNEAFARRLAGGVDVLGRRIQVGGTRLQPSSDAIPYQIVGVVGDARSSGTTAEIWDEVYVPHVQYNPSYGYLIVRSALDNDSLDRLIRQEIRAVIPQWVEDPVLRAMPLDTLVDQALAGPRFSATLTTAFSASALLLIGLGVFGLVAYSVSQRRHELGIRAALGARSSDLLIVTMRSAALWTAVGLAIGVIAASYVTRWIESQLYGTKPGDPITFATSAAVILAVTSVAAYLPARRAARVDPLVALRYE